MKIFADLHLHSKWSRATSRRMNIENLEQQAKIKGLNLLGSGDFTHPEWLKELKVKLKPLEKGIYRYKDLNFILSTEVSNEFRKEGKLRKIHNLLLAKNFDQVEQINDLLATYGDLRADGRPKLQLPCAELVELMKGISLDIEIIPAHAWTPWYSLYGSKAGFNSIKDCYEDQSKHVNALETGLSCYDSKTEILTNNGWKKIAYLSEKDEICTLNRKKELIEYQFPRNIFIYDYKGKMYKIKTKRVDLLVTPNHKLAIKKYPGSPGHRKNPDIELIKADKRFGVEKVFKKNGKWKGKESKYFILPQAEVRHGNRYYSGTRLIEKRSLPIKPWLKFFGLWIADGHISKVKGEYNVVVSNNDTKLLKDIKLELGKIGLKPYLRKNMLRVRNCQLWKYLARFGKAHQKWIPNEIKQLSPELLQLFLDYYLKGDGHKYGRNSKGVSATTSSQRLRDDLQEIALKIGVSAYWKHKVKPGEQILPSGHKNKHDVWVVYFIRKNEHRVFPANVRKYEHWEEKWANYEGKVWCVSVPNKIVYVRRNGIPIWCGNSDPPMNWRLSKLDKFALVSNSDSHSPWPYRIGREANVFDCRLSYQEIIKAIRTKDPKKFLYTIEVKPDYGKYHWTGHRRCGISMHPQEAIEKSNICPKCGRKLTVGVLQRVESLADRKEGYKPEGAIPYKWLLPLSELICIEKGISNPYAKSCIKLYSKLTKEKSEFYILLKAGRQEIRADKKLTDLIIANREGRIKVKPGYDGIYGKPLTSSGKQKRLEEF